MYAQTQDSAKNVLFHLLRNQDNRLKHTLTVVKNCESIAEYLKLDKDKKDLLLISAYLHDIGYSEDIAKTGFHPYDGYQYLKDNFWSHNICQLVLRHSEASSLPHPEGISLKDVYSGSLKEDLYLLYKILTVADMTSEFDGKVTTVESRYLGIMNRYGIESPITEHAGKLLVLVNRWTEELGLTNKESCYDK